MILGTCIFLSRRFDKKNICSFLFTQNDTNDDDMKSCILKMTRTIVLTIILLKMTSILEIRTIYYNISVYLLFIFHSQYVDLQFSFVTKKNQLNNFFSGLMLGKSIQLKFSELYIGINHSHNQC